MKSKRKLLSLRFKVIVFLLILLMAPLQATYKVSAQEEEAVQKQRIESVKQYIREQMLVSNIPGLAISIVHDGKSVMEEGFGYANLAEQEPVTDKTRFELGSTSKAFTGLAVLQLENMGLLKRDDPVTDYIPWLRMSYKGQPVEITLNHFLHHTSGIPFASIGRIPASEAKDALELTVRTLLNQPLNRMPGSSFEYATINYDVLGLVIEKVTGQSYELYIRESILGPLGMTATMATMPMPSDERAAGYKIAFGKQREYTPPVYRGNIPAGYISSNAQDMTKWIMFQLHAIGTSEIEHSLITDSHVSDRSVKPDMDGSYYAGGWSVYGDKQAISHTGNNPTFSSFVALYPDSKTGVAVLLNTNSKHAADIGRATLGIWLGHSPELVERYSDDFLMIDRAVSWLLLVWGGLSLVFLFLIGKVLTGIRHKQRERTKFTRKQGGLLSIHLFIFTLLAVTFISLLRYLFQELPWSFIEVWSPSSLPYALYGSFIMIILYVIYASLSVLFRKIDRNAASTKHFE
ncbi:beta-lactamase family protein [Paenibacillus sp. SC116]|uniref:serine hydrolase domain-containing protein n=1 Tax=Paenibacillus sp. SC116 TaxID=2968986 RepID=UPI00215A7A37|nr:serine hydrolase domain-containing protein [Paenibacillus sp. SC116]MCR8843795.1 beta-lactamase family protein [Paenibacillus sp. SC116]